VLTEEKLDEIDTEFEKSLRKQLVQIAKLIDMSVSA
jgi:hypothetical protein